MTHRKTLFAALLAAALTTAALANPDHHPPDAATPPGAAPMGMVDAMMGADPMDAMHGSMMGHMQGGMMRHMYQMMAHMQGPPGDRTEGMMNHGASGMPALAGLAGAEFEQAFMAMMIAHH